MYKRQLENATEGDSTLSCYVTSVTGTVTMFADDNTQVVLKQGLNVVHKSNSTKNFSIFLNRGTSITLKWVKLEQGKVATSFIAPNPAEELEKCLRFSRYIPTIYCVPLRRYIGDISNARAYYLPLGCVFETKLRAKGTISLKGGVFDSTSLSLGDIKEIDYSPDEIKQVIMPQEMTPWTLILKKVFIDAEIY